MQAEPRDYSFDNIRTLMVLFIVLLHAVCAYSSIVPWWHAQDAKNQLFDIILLLIDCFALPVLFFVSGLFAAPSYDRYGPVGFIAAKLKRLGIPLLVIPAFYLPTMVYVGYVHRVPNPKGFFDYWLQWMGTLSDWGYALITNMREGAKYADAFTPHHLWFISLLLIFFLGYACWRALSPRKAINLSAGMLALLAGMGVLVAFTAVNVNVLGWAWARLGPFLLFQPTRLPLYLIMFIFGVCARQHMGNKRPFPGSEWIWLTIFLMAQLVMMGMARKFILTPGPPPLQDALLHGALRAVLSVSAVCFFVNLGRRFLAGSSRWRQSLASSSYDIYLLHMPVTVFVQAFLVALPLPLLLKALAAFMVPTFLFWWLGRVLAQRNYAVSAGLLGVYFIGFCLAS